MFVSAVVVDRADVIMFKMESESFQVETYAANRVVSIFPDKLTESLRSFLIRLSWKDR